MNDESLSVVAEVGAAFAGFASLVGALRGENARARRSAFGVVETGLIAVAFALLPRMVVNLRIAALMFFFVWSAAWLNAIRQFRKSGGGVSDRSYASPLFIAASFSLQLSGSVLALLVVFGAWPEQAPRLYESAVLCALLVSCLLLWLTVGRFATDGGELHAARGGDEADADAE